MRSGWKTLQRRSVQGSRWRTKELLRWFSSAVLTRSRETVNFRLSFVRDFRKTRIGTSTKENRRDWSERRKFLKENNWQVDRVKQYLWEKMIPRWKSHDIKRERRRVERAKFRKHKILIARVKLFESIVNVTSCSRNLSSPFDFYPTCLRISHLGSRTGASKNTVRTGAISHAVFQPKAYEFSFSSRIFHFVRFTRLNL